ncbi:UDP-2,3-diacylglucosamine diphosphatase [Pasteurellaceae bacterium Macca]|nr:UDP-2,3-diacylglucosamine diphosphatase [Pasteurellaceae bacterium Macca]
MSYYFIADLHLSENEPTMTADFLHFLQTEAPQAKALYILGDLFDFWIGDDENSPFITEVKHALRHLTEQGVECYFIHGNRDFLLGKRFAAATGITLLPSYHTLTLYDKKILLCHGDTLCIDDVKYQQFRRKVHQKWRQRLFLCLPLALRLHIAKQIRAKSQQEKGAKSVTMMDVNPTFTTQMAEQYQAHWLIHGHTHRQGVHKDKFLEKSDRLFYRIVLGDWHPNRPSILQVDEQGFHFLDPIEKTP